MPSARFPLVVLLLALASPAAVAQKSDRLPLVVSPSAPGKEFVTVGAAASAGAVVFAMLPVASKFIAGRREDFEAMVAVHAKANSVPERLVHRVILRESKYQPNLVGRGGTIGLMQIKLATARGLGFTGTADELRDPQINMTWAVKYLGGAYRAANGNEDRAVRNYAAGYHVPRKLRRAIDSSAALR